MLAARRDELPRPIRPCGANDSELRRSGPLQTPCTHACMHVHARAHTHIPASTHAHTPTQTHTHTHTHTHTYRRPAGSAGHGPLRPGRRSRAQGRKSAKGRSAAEPRAMLRCRRASGERPGCTPAQQCRGGARLKGGGALRAGGLQRARAQQEDGAQRDYPRGHMHFRGPKFVRRHGGGRGRARRGGELKTVRREQRGAVVGPETRLLPALRRRPSSAARDDRFLHPAADGPPHARMFLPHDGSPSRAGRPLRWASAPRTARAVPRSCPRPQAPQTPAHLVVCLFQRRCIFCRPRQQGRSDPHGRGLGAAACARGAMCRACSERAGTRHRTARGGGARVGCV